MIILICSTGEILYKPATKNKRFTKDMPSSNDLREKVIIKGKRVHSAKKKIMRKKRRITKTNTNFTRV